MPDNRHITEPRDRIEINVHEPYELKRWADKFGVSEERLRQAVRTVGPMVENVKRHLGI